MRSAKQSIKHFIDVSYIASEISGDLIEVRTVSALVTGWLTDVKITIEYETLNDKASVGVQVSNDEDWGEVDDIGPVNRQVMNGWTTNGNIASVMMPTVPMYFHMNHLSAASTRMSKRKNYSRPVVQGENINLHVFFNDHGNTITTGVVNISAEFTVVIGALNSKAERHKKGSARGAEVAILGSFDGTKDKMSWLPPCNGRIGNVRLTWFKENDTSVMGWSYVGQNEFTDPRENADEWYAVAGAGLFMPFIDSDTGDVPDIRVQTDYDDEVYFVKKGSLFWWINQISSGNDIELLLEFTFIPDFKSQVDFWISNNIDDLSVGVLLRIFQIPFDMYVEELEFTFRMSPEAVGAWEGTIYIAGLKDTPEVLTTMTKVLTGSIPSTSGVQANQSGVLPSYLLKAIQYRNAQPSYTGGGDPKIQVHDYFPAGSFIMMVIDTEVAASGTVDVDAILNISGKSRVKSSRMGTNYLTGDNIYAGEGEA